MDLVARKQGGFPCVTFLNIPVGDQNGASEWNHQSYLQLHPCSGPCSDVCDKTNSLWFYWVKGHICFFFCLCLQIFSCLMIFFLCNMMETHFLSTGAFEVTLNGESLLDLSPFLLLLVFLLILLFQTEQLASVFFMCLSPSAIKRCKLQCAPCDKFTQLMIKKILKRINIGSLWFSVFKIRCLTQ